MAVQEGLTSIRVSWTPSNDATGYTISYTGGGSRDTVNVSGGSIDNYLLTGLDMEASYTISIVATSQHFFSGSVEIPDVTLGENVHVVYVTYALIVEIHLPTPYMYIHLPQFLLPMCLLLTWVELCQHPPPSPSHGLLMVITCVAQLCAGKCPVVMAAPLLGLCGTMAVV